MAIVDKSGSINNLSSVDTPSSKKAQNVTDGGKVRFLRDTVEIAAADDDGSKYRLARIPANAVISSIVIATDAITGGTDFDLGFYDTPEVNAGAVIVADALVDGQTLASASRVLDGTSNVDIADLAKKAWEALEKFTGRSHTHLVIGRSEEKISFQDIQAQPRKIISSPTWSGIESEKVSYTAGYVNVNELLV